MFNTNGQANANANGICTFSSIAKSGSFARNNCEVGGVSSAVVYTVPAGRHTSTTSQAAADELAQADLNNNGQANANTNGTCTFSSIARSGSFAKSNCATGGSGSSVAFSQAAGVQTSTISQADADSNGLALFNTNGQANANMNGICTFSNAAVSKTFTRNNCPANTDPGTYAYSIAYGEYTSNISQLKADQLAQNALDTYGQNWANEEATCTFYSASKSGTFTRNNCPSGYTGGSVTYTVPYGAHFSTISQADADNKAQLAVNNNGQAYANSNASCTQIPQEVTFEYEYFFNASNRQLTIDAWASGTNHNGATLNFTVNYVRTSGASSQVVAVVFSAGQGAKLTTVALPIGTKSISGISLQVVKN